MNRLTTRNSDGAWDVPIRNDDDGAYIPSQEIIDRLAAYEETGLEPEQINCVNTNVYVNWRDDVFNDSGTEQLTIDSVGFMTRNGTFYAFDEIGKTVFLTREDAEKALEVANNDE